MQIEIKQHNGYKALFVDGQLFDWEMDTDSLLKAKKFCAENATLKKSVEGDIQKHFLESFSEFIGHPITLNEVIELIRNNKNAN
jgi:hypothetical protein